MKNIYSNPLNFTIPPLKEEFNITKITQSHVVVDLDEMNPKMKTLLDSLGIKVSWIELFYRKPGYPGSIHVDSIGGDFTKINWVTGGKNSTMVWFKIINSAIEKNKISLTTANTGYIEYKWNEVTIVHREFMLGPALVQVGVPHLVINPSDDRYCLSFVLTDLYDKRLTMTESYKLLKDYII
jgi:hypothetical protein